MKKKNWDVLWTMMDILQSGACITSILISKTFSLILQYYIRKKQVTLINHLWLKSVFASSVDYQILNQIFFLFQICDLAWVVERVKIFASIFFILHVSWPMHVGSGKGGSFINDVTHIWTFYNHLFDPHSVTLKCLFYLHFDTYCHKSTSPTCM